MLAISGVEELRPWMRGPFELVRHADGHRNGAEDTDRRIALIGFDNAIEVSIDVFIRLHPRMRGGLEFPRDEITEAQRNYHTKVSFLDRHVQSQQIPIAVQVDEIIWYHQLRNELYHSGNGMVPEKHVILGARAAALAVFGALFGVDIAGLLSEGGIDIQANQPAERSFLRSGNPEMEFLGWFIELEQEVRKAVRNGNDRAAPFREMWQILLQERPDLRDLEPKIAALSRTRNAIIHGQPALKGEETELEDALGMIIEIMDRMTSHSR